MYKNNVGLFSTLAIKFCVVSFKAVFQTHVVDMHSVILMYLLYECKYIYIF
jgi:hypothetical protein